MLGILKMDIDTCITKYAEMSRDIFPDYALGKLWKAFKLGSDSYARFDP